MKTTILLRWSP
ncbi:hypothetical protein LINPERPRIM_LOCUS2622 [Linum perenne]